MALRMLALIFSTAKIDMQEHKWEIYKGNKNN